jgi:bifunctional non-homologous end joining protein LigD
MRRKRDDKDVAYCVLDTKAALIWAANLANLELHVSLAKGAQLRPSHAVFDLDPDPDVGIIGCCRVALWIRDLLGELGLEIFPKTSGSKGLQLFVPLNRATTFDKTGAFAHAIATRMQEEHPDDVLTKMSKELRRGKVFIDWSQNDNHKTTACVYSLRAKEYPSVSTPLEWKEVETALKKNDAERLVFGPKDVLRRVKKSGDLFEPVLKLKQVLPRL